MALSGRCFCLSSVFTRAHVAAMPFFHTFSAANSHPGTCRPRNSSRRRSRSQPASSNAPRVMSPLMPEKQSKYASFMGVRHNRGKPRGGYAWPARNVSDGSISILSAALRGVKSEKARGPPPPTFPDLRNLKDLRALQLDLHILRELRA